MLVPLRMIFERVDNARSDSDTALFHELLYAGEFILKLTTAVFVAAIQDDRERHRYRLMHSLIRADGIGEWSSALDDALTGPASHVLLSAAKEDRRLLTERVGIENWQFDAVNELYKVLRLLQNDYPSTPTKVALRAWFSAFPELRNKTRAHGAPRPAFCHAACEPLEKSLRLIAENAPSFRREWAYLHRNLSGKYRIVPLTGTATSFEFLKSKDAIDKNLEDNLYIQFQAPCKIELIHTNLDCADFFVPNGAYNGRRFELHSLITDSRLDGDAALYLAPAIDRPASETEGLGRLDVIGKTFSNLPPPPIDYVPRAALEQEVEVSLRNDRHAIITLVGRGGIGKTSLALSVLQSVAQSDRFAAMVWFSARDIDLTVAGPKIVRPRVLTEQDISEQFVELLDPSHANEQDFRATKYMANCLGRSPVGPILFIFDNFETVRSPIDLFHWIDTNVRLPNKVLITTRFRDFKADFPIEIHGMDRAEAFHLIEKTAQSLSCAYLLTNARKDEIFDESDGHPYVMKIVLGEIAAKGSYSKPERIVARKEDILDALFDRTFGNLSPAAKRVFLTLSGWRSMVPALALEAVLLRHAHEPIDAEQAIDELARMSFVQREKAGDGTEFLDMPLSAMIFGQRKLSVSPLSEIIANDVRLLQDLGPTTDASLRDGLAPRIRSIFQKVARRILTGSTTLDEMEPVLEFIARSYPEAWVLLADLYEECAPLSSPEKVGNYLRHFLEQLPDHSSSGEVWERLASLYKTNNDVVGACAAFIKAYNAAEVPLHVISNVANWVNSEHAAIASMDAADKASIFKPLAALMDRRLSEASATDLSRLAWLYLHSGDTQRALHVSELGLKKDPSNRYCQRVIERLRT